MAAEEEEMLPLASTSSGTAQSHGGQSRETFIQSDKPSDRVLNKVARHISAGWRSLGHELKVPHSKMEEISVQYVLYPTMPAKAFFMLKAWKNRGESVTYDELCRALNKLGMNELAESLRSDFLPRSSVPEYVLDRGFIAAYQRALELGETSDKRVKVLLIGQDRVGKTSVGRSLKGEKFKKDESSTEGVQMDEVLKNVGSEPWTNSSEEKEITAFDHQCALYVSNELTATSAEEMAHLGPIEPSNAPSTNTPGIENPESKHEIQKVSLPDENPNKGQEKQKVNIPPRIVRLANENRTKNRRDGDDGIWPVIMDFAGQAIYRAIHPIFVSSEAVYVLMFDLTKHLHSNAQCYVGLPERGEIHIQTPDSNDTNLDHILRWMDLVHSFKHGGGENFFPPVILVGTKADLVEHPHEIIGSLTDSIHETWQVFIKHVKETIAVDNTRAGEDKEDPNIVKLRNEILKVGKEMLHTRKKVPLKWLQVENKVYELASKGENYITRYDFEKNICDGICQFEHAGDFEALLLFLHDRGTVVYHGYASDPDCLVVLNPKWLIDILCQLITTEEQQEEPFPIKRLRKELGKSGKLKAELLDHSCEKLGVTDIKKSLLFIMKKFNLLCEYIEKDGNTIHLVPCMLTSKPEGNLESNIAENKDPAPVFLTFNTQYVPGGLFSRLIVLFVEFTSRITTCRQPVLHSNFARFFLGAVTGVEFVCYKRVIKVSIWDYTNSSSHPLDKEPQICSKLLSFLQNSLKKLQKECHWMRQVTWDLCARCNLCQAELATMTGECVWHRKQACRREDCAHYVSLTAKPFVCSRTEGRDCRPPETWSQALEDTPAFQALQKQPGEYETQRRGEHSATALPSTSLQDSVPLGKGLKRIRAKKSETKREKGVIKRLKRMKAVKGDSEVEGEVETTAKKGRLKGLKHIRTKKGETKREKGVIKRLKRIKAVKGDSEGEGEIETTAKKRRPKGLRGIKTMEIDAKVKGEIETDEEKREFKVKDGCPSDDKLEGLSIGIVSKWKKLGRRLKFRKERLVAFDQENHEWSEKGYALLLAWKERDGSAATYRVLYEALCHEYVNRRDLAHEFCCS